MNIQFFSDKLSIGISSLCAAHCLVTPLLLAVFPLLQGSFLTQELFHQSLIIIIMPLSILAAVIGCRKHQNKAVICLISTGLLSLLLAVFVMHDLLGEMGETLFTLIGAGLIAYGHFKNYQLCRVTNCGCNEEN